MISYILPKGISNISKSLFTKTKFLYYSSEKAWKQRDQSAEKVYISRTQKQAMKKLLDKLNQEEGEFQSKFQAFQSDLTNILNKYKINNPAFKAEILHLHKQL